MKKKKLLLVLCFLMLLAWLARGKIENFFKPKTSPSNTTEIETKENEKENTANPEPNNTANTSNSSSAGSDPYNRAGLKEPNYDCPSDRYCNSYNKNEWRTKENMESIEQDSLKIYRDWISQTRRGYFKCNINAGTFLSEIGKATFYDHANAAIYETSHYSFSTCYIRNENGQMEELPVYSIFLDSALANYIWRNQYTVTEITGYDVRYEYGNYWRHIFFNTKDSKILLNGREIN